MDKLCEAMKQTGISCDEARQTMRVEIMKQAVLESEVDRKIFYNFTADELRKYFDANKDKFLKPGVGLISRKYFSAWQANRKRSKTRADQLVSQARGGADFCTLAAAYSDRPGNNGQKPCKVGLFQVPDLRPDIAGAIKNLKAGGVSDPLKSDEGYQILRVDARTAGSNTATFNENQARGAMTQERSPKGARRLPSKFAERGVYKDRRQLQRAGDAVAQDSAARGRSEEGQEKG